MTVKRMSIVVGLLLLGCEGPEPRTPEEWEMVSECAARSVVGSFPFDDHRGIRLCRQRVRLLVAPTAEGTD